MPKNNRHGQASVLSDQDYSKILKTLTNNKHRLFLQIARYTGERWGAIAQLKVSDVFNQHRIPRDYITFRSCTRKGSPTGEHETRQVPLHSQLQLELKIYKPPQTLWLFPNHRQTGPMTFDNADDFFRRAMQRAGLEDRGFSTHSTRRTLISRLARAGVGIRVIQAVTGHRDLKVLQRYIEIGEDQIVEAIARL